MLAAAEDALRLVLERGVFGEAGEHLLLIAGVQTPRVAGEQFLDLEAVFDGDLGTGQVTFLCVVGARFTCGPRPRGRA
jgi:hypothetical protein